LGFAIDHHPRLTPEAEKKGEHAMSIEFRRAKMIQTR
jgi:hypothetical protein